ncbi:hypothetical protein Ctha_0460 [Chloroherpeton thalassium ATCC 35110]|uniref:STAS/SEC14 domain-containing protein n=1 Tax=Chloroherpeton thalassium (strain ATCC 35110 / GB-78) TaxID=517418 RepID=B3QUM5_CHLT3|nr:STAS/SEC14 domain-containing protein [Chloroherpeton thalassium]ACF12931.1 hypothetical protein Ctha_0460 [Chloroherpeton thalassium ATCC 35110]
MTATVSMDLSQHLVRIDFSGKLDVKDIIRSLKNLIENPDYQKGTSLLFDFSEAYIDADYYELDRLRNYISAICDFLGECKCAFVTHNNPSKVVIKLLSIMCEAYHLGFHAQIFEEQAAALKWLQAEDVNQLHQV